MTIFRIRKRRKWINTSRKYGKLNKCSIWHSSFKNVCENLSIRSEDCQTCILISFGQSSILLIALAWDQRPQKYVLPEGVVEVRVDSWRKPHLVCPVHPNTSTLLYSLVLLYVCQRKHGRLKIWPPESISQGVTRPIAIFCRFA